MAPDPTARSRRLWDRMAPRYDRDMRRLEPLLFGRDARPAVCAQADTCRTTRPASGSPEWT